MHIVWFSWKDTMHPQAGGAETVSGEIRKRLVQNGHTVTLITAQYPGSKKTSKIDGTNVLRVGGRYTVYLRAKKAYKGLDQTADIIIDEMNTIPFLTPLYTKGAKNILLTYQLARKVWFYQMVFPLSLIGYILEPIYLRFISNKYNKILTESESTKKDLSKYGFEKSSVFVFPVGIEIKPLAKVTQKKSITNVIFLGAFRPMKRPLDAVKAFEIARDKDTRLTLDMAGSTSGRYGKKVLEYVANSRHKKSITVHGRISSEHKIRLLRDAALIIVTSTKEGWGLIATEANSQGTPAIGYDVDGLRDSIVHDITGKLAPSGDYRALAKEINNITANKDLHAKLSQKALENSKQYTFDNSYTTFARYVGLE